MKLQGKRFKCRHVAKFQTLRQCWPPKENCHQQQNQHRDGHHPFFKKVMIKNTSKLYSWHPNLRIVWERILFNPMSRPSFGPYKYVECTHPCLYIIYTLHLEFTRALLRKHFRNWHWNVIPSFTSVRTCSYIGMSIHRYVMFMFVFHAHLM